MGDHEVYPSHTVGSGVECHKLRNSVGCFSTNLARRFGALDKGDFEEGPEEVKDATMIVYTWIYR